MFGIAHRSVRASPHFLQFEFLDSSLVGGDGSALDTDRILLDSLGRVDSDLIVGCISALHSQVVVLEVNIDEGQDKLLPDLLPDDPCHLITVNLNHRVLDLDPLDTGRGGSIVA